jgi:hypothetical protein
MEDEKYIEKLTGDHIKMVGYADPSFDFTGMVMKSIALKAVVKEEPWIKRYWWSITIIPLMGIVTWFLSSIINLKAMFISLQLTVNTIINPFYDMMIGLGTSLKNMSISPFILVSFTAILLLLVIEELVARMKRTL